MNKATVFFDGTVYLEAHLANPKPIAVGDKLTLSSETLRRREVIGVTDIAERLGVFLLKGKILPDPSTRDFADSVWTLNLPVEFRFSKE